MKIFILVVAAVISMSGPAVAQGIYLDLGLGGPRQGYQEEYNQPRIYREERRDRGYYRPQYRTWNGCQNGWTVQDGVCKPYRGY
jgi:hypothetical protein